MRSPERTFPRETDAPIPAASPEGAAARPDRAAALATIVVCSSCRGPDGADARPRPGERLAEATRAAAAGQGVRVREAECLGNCRRRLSAAVLAPDGWSYVFGDLAEESGPDLVAGALLLAAAEDGIMPWRGRPDCLKRGLVARIPPLASPDDA